LARGRLAHCHGANMCGKSTAHPVYVYAVNSERHYGILGAKLT